jgi:hypothetical protein
VVRVALYSACYGSYERLVKPLPVDLGVRAVMFTDDPHLPVPPGWEVRVHRLGIATFLGRPSTTAPMLAHKWWKCRPDLALPDVDVSLWVDGSMTICVDRYVERCLDALGDDDWVMVRHPARDCALEEAAFSALLPRYDPAALRAQAAYYRSIGHPAHWGLFATGANVRRHTPAVAEVGQQWWWENVTRSHQDQVSLPVLLRLAGDKVRWNTRMPWGEWWGISEHGS